jgi:outer membrane protein assembly factor BamB
VTTARSGLVSYELVAGDLKKVWSVPMENAALAGPPLLVNGKLLAALNTGKVLALSPEDGSVVGKVEVGQVLTDGPKRVGNKLFVPSIDGTLQSVESVLQAAKQ